MYDDGYDVFRQAIVERDADAWAAIAQRYRNLLIAWVARCPGADVCGERYEDLADEAFARAWQALSPERFLDFPGLAALLAYMRTCVSATVIDALRSSMKYERAFQLVDETSTQTEYMVIERLEREALWQHVMNLTASEAERVALRERFVYDLPPRIILARHPALFQDINVVYTTIRNLCDRFQRNRGLSRRYTEHLAV
jgi:DNA-directed RNA polymerase specialized sigma24 family protein